MSEFLESIDANSEESEQQIEAHNRQVGAKVLAIAGFENRQKAIVDSSFDKARKNGEKLPGKNNERRDYAYISRLEKLVEKYGNSIEKKLWKASLDKMIIKPENITDSYWDTQEQILRDNGQGRELDDYEKDILAEDIQKQQRQSLESWSNYLGDENSPYPLWFKVYAWDGVSKMGVFDKEKGCFKKRDEHTVAPYPKLNPAVLAKTYGIIANYYGIKDNERYEEKNEILEALAASGNFNKLYSKILLSEKVIPKTPEKTEDIHGEWLEYLPGDEERLANAAEGTPWCIASPGTGKNYLEFGNYSGEGNDYGGNRKNKAKFILFHLYNPEKNTLSESACASIRLSPEGKVAEISGLNEGQALEDSLVPIVREKVKTLPGGEDYLEAFADKQTLISLDRKMHNGEDLSKNELEFLFEINRPIKTLDTYNDSDPRIKELKEKYDIEYALTAGIDADLLLAKSKPWVVHENLDSFINHGDVNQLLSSKKINSYTIAANLDALISHGADISLLMSKIEPWAIAANLDTLIDHGANIDINQLMPELGPGVIAANLDTLIDHGANIDINQLMSKLELGTIVKNLDTLVNHGVDINTLMSKLRPSIIVNNLDTLISHGADISLLMSKIEPWAIAANLDTLISHGASIDIDQLVSKLDRYEISLYINALRRHGYQG